FVRLRGNARRPRQGNRHLPEPAPARLATPHGSRRRQEKALMLAYKIALRDRTPELLLPFWRRARHNVMPVPVHLHQGSARIKLQDHPGLSGAMFEPGGDGSGGPILALATRPTSRVCDRGRALRHTPPLRSARVWRRAEKRSESLHHRPTRWLGG